MNKTKIDQDVKREINTENIACYDKVIRLCDKLPLSNI